MAIDELGDARSAVRDVLKASIPINPAHGEWPTMTDRDLTTTRTQVFGDVAKGTECQVCGRDVEDGRAKTCSDYCSNLLSAVMGMLNWSSVRREVIDRDDETCQRCGFDYSYRRRARDYIRDRIETQAGDRPESPGLKSLGSDESEGFDWDEYYEQLEAWRDRRRDLMERYGDPYEAGRGLEVDHITPVSEGGHPFDPGNLQTLCEECHQEKTSQENSERAQTPSRGELSKSLFDYAAANTSE